MIVIDELVSRDWPIEKTLIIETTILAISTLRILSRLLLTKTIVSEKHID